MVDLLEGAIVLLSYLYPITVLITYFCCSLAAIVTLQTARAAEKARHEHPCRRATIGALGLYLCSYVAQVVVVGVYAAIHREWPVTEYTIIRPFSCILVFGIQLSQLLNTAHPVWYPFCSSWAQAVLFELAITTLTLVQRDVSHMEYVQWAEFAFAGVRCVSLIGTMSWLLVQRQKYHNQSKSDEERQSLLKDDDANGVAQNANKPGYGATENGSATVPEFNWERRDREGREAMETRLREGGNWFQYAKGFMVSALSYTTASRCADKQGVLPTCLAGWE